jgi:hypothetical protein
MKWPWLIGVVMCSSWANAKDANPISTFVRDALSKHAPVQIAAGTAMPADKYRMKGPPDSLTFSYLIWHIADGNYLYCAAIGATPAPKLSDAGEFDPKDQLLARMKSSFDFCNGALAKLDDTQMSEVITMGDTKMSRAMAILTLAGSWATHDAQLDAYLKQN